MILLILIYSSAALARLPTPTEKPLWDISPERAACISACNPNAIHYCEGGSACDCSAKCFDTDAPKFCARLDSKTETLAAETYHAAALESVNAGMTSLLDGIDSSDSEKISFGVSALEAAKELNGKENVIRERMKLESVPLAIPAGIETRAINMGNKIPHESFLSRALESPRLIFAELKIEKLEAPAPAPKETAEPMELGKKLKNSLRAELKKKLASAQTLDIESEHEGDTRTESTNTLTGLSPAPDFKADSELTLFDVIHFKYREMERNLKQN